jgi:hypothetical protein
MTPSMNFQASAVTSGLVGTIGQDGVQAIMSDAFGKVRWGNAS